MNATCPPLDVVSHVQMHATHMPCFSLRSRSVVCRKCHLEAKASGKKLARRCKGFVEQTAGEPPADWEFEGLDIDYGQEGAEPPSLWAAVEGMPLLPQRVAAPPPVHRGADLDNPDASPMSEMSD